MLLLTSFIFYFLNDEQMRKWKAWEDETQTLHYQISNGNLDYFSMLFSLLYVLKRPSLATPIYSYCWSHLLQL
jgi:hypothetical protein